MPALKNILATAAFVSLAYADVHTVTAREDNTFDPDTVEAEEGDTIEFRFERGNHSVVAGLYDFPCAPLELQKSFFSGFIETQDENADKIFRIMVNDTEPIAFYSSVDMQCAEGMVGMINPNDMMKLDDYRQNAKGLAEASSPGGEAYGGELIDARDAEDDEEFRDDDIEGERRAGAGMVGAPLLSLVAAFGMALMMA